MSTANIILMIAVSAAVTFFLRILPFFAFSGEQKMPEWLDRLGQALPPAIMAVLLVYCLRDIPYDLENAAVPKLLGVAATFISYRFKHNSLISGEKLRVSRHAA